METIKSAARASGFFQARGVFRRDEFALWAAARGVRPRSIDSALRYHATRGRIVRVRRGLYASVPPGVDAAAVLPDRFVIAAHTAADAVIGYHGALELHDQARSASSTVVVVTARPFGVFDFRGTRFRATRPPSRVAIACASTWETVSVSRLGTAIRVTSLERTVVDCLHRLQLAGGSDEAWESVRSIPLLDAERVTECALRIGSRTTAARVGLLLELHRERWGVRESQLARLRAAKPRSPHYFARSYRGPRTHLREWNLIVPDLFVRDAGESIG